jgi:RimJ/RimL family protein N-acetyltransferase
MTLESLGTLYTGQLVRLAAQSTDLHEAMARWSNDSEYMRLLIYGPACPRPADAFTPDDDRRDNPSEISFAIRTLADDKLIGECELEVSWNHQSAWVGIGIGEPDYRGKGYGTDAMRVLVGYGFRELGLHRIQLGVFGFNTRAIRSYEKAGFVREQVLRGGIFKDGVHYDEYRMGLLRPEWEAMQVRQS